VLLTPEKVRQRRAWLLLFKAGKGGAPFRVRQGGDRGCGKG
jgi:hypothetical protein